MEEKKSISGLVDLIFSTSRLLKEKVKCEHKNLQLSFVNIGMLRYIEEHGNPTMKEIADHFLISAPSVTSMVEMLIKSDHLMRVTDPNDRRVVRVSMTENGKKEFERILENVKSKIGEVLNNLAKDDLEKLNNILIELNKHLKA